jgi:hypothetical protein
VLRGSFLALASAVSTRDRCSEDKEVTVDFAGEALLFGEVVRETGCDLPT